jgi:type IV pilus assembly protein PilB
VSKPAVPPPAAKAPAKPAAPAAKAPEKPSKKASSNGSTKAKARAPVRPKLAQIFVDLGYMEEEQADDILQESETLGQAFERVAQSRGLVTEDQIIQALSEQHGIPAVNLNEVKPSAEAVALVNEPMATVYKVLPLAFKDGVLTIVISDPANVTAIDDLRNFLNVRNIQAVLASAQAVEEAIIKTYQGKSESIVDIIQALESDEKTGGKSRRSETSIDLDELMELADSAPVRKLINMVFLMAIRDRASDIHFEPFEDEYKMRYKCDGVLMEMVPPPRHLAMAISSRIKVMANLDIAERRLPQDGRIELALGGNPVDMRVSVLPTMFGESIVIRVLDRTVVNLSLEAVGMPGPMLDTFRQLIHKPNGILLVTGPTGSGKTTTLYSALNELNQITDKLITTEDPVEYEIDGICQVPINAEIDLTFAAALRAILRQDPDVILVGEIRDLETAQIAIQASLTGHMVFSTLHTNDAASAVTRLRDMGVEPYLITATVEGILAQRLIRKICVGCRAEFRPSQEMLMELNLKPEDVAGKKFFYGSGCPICNNTGYKGRSGLFELIPMDNDLRDLVANGGSTDQIRDHVRKKGIEGLREAGMAAMFNGITTIDEILRETVLEDEH